MFTPSSLVARLIHGGLLFVFAIIGSNAFSQTVVTINPGGAIGPKIIRAGWDIKEWPARLNTIGEANGLYQDVDANFLRVPFFPQAHAEDGTVDESQYDIELDAIRSVMAVRPDVEIYASVKLSGANTFPAWVSQATPNWPFQNGQIFGNTVGRPNPDHYSTMLVDFLQYLRDEGIRIHFLGINNETGGAVTPDRYVATYDLLESKLDAAGFFGEYRDFEYVGPDSFGIPTAERFVDDVADMGRLDTIDFVASHYYPQHVSGNESDWLDLSNLSGGKPLWHTELHMPGNTAAINELSQTVRDALSVQFASFRNGVDSYIWWDSGNSLNEVRDVIKREVMTTTLEATPVFTTPGYQGKGDPDGLPLFQAFVEDTQVTLWIVNPGAAMNNLPVSLVAGQVAVGLEGEYYLAPDGDNNLLSSDIVPLTFNVATNGSVFSIDHIPAQSAAVVSFNMAEPGFFAANPGFTGTDGNVNRITNYPNQPPIVSGAVNDITVDLVGGNLNNAGIASKQTINELFDAFNGGSLEETDAVVLTFEFESVGDIAQNGIELGISPNGTGFRPAGNFFFVIDDNGALSGMAQGNVLGLGANDAGFGFTEASLSDGFTATLTADVNGFTFDFTDVVVAGSGNTSASFSGNFTGTQFLDIFSNGHMYSTTQRGLPDPANPTVFSDFSITVDEDSVTPFLLGDCNIDGFVNFLDIACLIELLASAEFIAQADCNQDGAINFLDIAPFIDILTRTS